MKVVILAGGLGTRISEESVYKPKPMIEIGNMPILWHIMKEYSYYGFHDFVICAGYKQHMIKEWFADYFLHTSDITFDFTRGQNEMIVHNHHTEPWKVTVVDTGLNTMTGGRIKRIRPYIGNETFMMTYGDGVCDVDIAKLVAFHRENGKIATLTAVQQEQQKGVLDIAEDNSVRSFREKKASDGALINAGYMVLEPQIFDYLDGDACVFEQKPLQKLAEEDPTFRVSTNQETGQTIIAGMGELHLEIIVDRLMREFKVEANVGAPQVAYKETITKEAASDTKYKRQSGGSGQYGHCKIRIMPNIDPETGIGKGYEFVNQIVGGSIPKEYIPAVDAGIQGAMKSGILAGYNVVDVRVELYDGSYHEVDSSEMAFKIAGSMAFKDAAKKAGPIILEPMMKVVVIVPEEYMGDVIGDLNSRRGQIQGMEDRNGAKQINARVPLSEMFGYVNDLRSKTQGRGQYTMEPDGYEPVPKSISESIISERAKKD